MKGLDKLRSTRVQPSFADRRRRILDMKSTYRGHCCGLFSLDSGTVISGLDGPVCFPTSCETGVGWCGYLYSMR